MKIDLRDTTFLVIIRLDSIERLENVLAVTHFLSTNFDTIVKVWECNNYNNGVLSTLLDKEVEYKFVCDSDPILYRTKYLNEMILSVETSYVSVWDADVISSAKQLEEAVILLRSKDADFVYPYESKMLDTSIILRNLYLETGDLDFLHKHSKKMEEMYPPLCVGGAFFCDTKSYIDIGMENDKFYGWGVEDGERYMRWKESGYKVKRITGLLFHLSHPRGLNSLIPHTDQSLIKSKIFEDSVRGMTFKKNIKTYGNNKNS